MITGDERIIFRNLTYTYPGDKEPTLKELNLEFHAGEFVLVVGPSGGGKSTFLRCLNGLVPHFYGGSIAGKVSIFGREPIVSGPLPMSDMVGFVFQDPEAQFIVDNVEDEIAFAMEARAYPRALMIDRVHTVSQMLNIKQLLGRRVSTLSGGQRQRVAVAAALALQPRLLVLDEPTSQLDPVAAEELITALMDLNREQGLTIFLSEHRLERVAEYAHRVLYIPGQGQPPLCGQPRDILPEAPLAPPVVRLAKALSWQPMPLSVEEALPQAQALPPLPPANGHNLHSSGEPLLTADNLKFSYANTPQAALAGVSLALCSGEILAIQGHNGAGKTTLLKSLVGLLHPKSGKVSLQGLDIAKLPLSEIIKRVGYVPQSPGSLLFQETVREELEFTRHSHDLPPQDPLPLLQHLGLAEYAETYPRDLSQGERQRVALAAILVAEPDILLLDEPTLGLDYKQKDHLIELLRQLRAQGKAILMATHDIELVAACADRTLVLAQGQVSDEGQPGQVMLRHPAYASQVNRLFQSADYLTVEDVLSKCAI